MIGVGPVLVVSVGFGEAAGRRKKMRERVVVD